MGAVAALAVILFLAPSSINSAGYVPVVVGMAKIAAWIVGPSMILIVVSGLLSMAITPAFQDAGWVWAKAATGILLLEGGLTVLGPLQEEARRTASALPGSQDPALLARLIAAEGGTMWVLLAVSAINIALGVWRPRFAKFTS
jgi:hypothetical protein